MAELPSGTVTFLFTDLEGSTRLWEEHPDAMQAALARHDEIVSSAIASRDGHVVKTTGDGFHAAFRTAHEALGAALDAQRALAAEPWAATGPLLVRMGLHTGETQERDGDYYGTAVNRAARLMAVAHGGQVVCSRATVEVAGEAFPVRSLGEHRLRDLGTAQEIFQVGDGAFPPLRSVDAVPTNLPTVRTELIGRGNEVRGIAELVVRERLVTLTGVGGVGKTRLALGVAAGVAAEFADGCWFVELAPVADGDEVVTVVAASMHVPTTDVEALAAYLADRRMLVVLDNCEHVLDAAAELVDEVLARAPDVHVVVTSREPLGLEGEHVRRVQSLALPDAHAQPDAARGTAAVRLFAERAAAVADGFAVDDDNAEAVVEICRHLDGIPLAIELAAARVRAMAPAEIASRLDERFRLLAGGSRRAQERHRTLLATVAWSHDLLTEPEKVVFRRLSVFPASFDLAAAEAVVAGDGVDVVECVLRLVDRSLVVYEPGANRYRLLETLRQFGAERLTDVGETGEIRHRHAAWFLALADRLGPGLDDSGFVATRSALIADLDNLRSTADWCVESGSWIELATMSERVFYFLTQDAPVDGAGWFEQVVLHGSEVEPRVLVDALGFLAWFQTMNFGAFGVAGELAERSASLATEHSIAGSPWASLAAAQGAVLRGRFEDGDLPTEQAIRLAEARDNVMVAVIASNGAGMILAERGELERSAEIFTASLERAARSGSLLLLQATVITTAQSLVWREKPDFATSLDVLDRYGTDLLTGGLGNLWLDMAWGITLLGLDRPGAATHAARAARAADHQGSPHALDMGLRVLGLAAAEAGLTEQAAAIVGYADANLSAYEFAQPRQRWFGARLDRALGDRTTPSAAAGMHRRELMVLISDVEATLASEST